MPYDGLPEEGRRHKYRFSRNLCLMRYPTFRKLLLGIVVLLYGGCGDTGETVDTEGTVEIGFLCDGCSVHIERVAAMGRPDDEVALMPQSVVSVGIDGSYYVAPTAERGVIALYDTAGNFVSTFGRSGQGPGELSDRVHVRPADDGSVMVFDATQARLNFFTAKGNFIDARPFGPIQFSGVLALSDGVVSNAMDDTRDRGGNPLHFIRGDSVRSFGNVDERIYRPGNLDRFVRVLARSDDHHFWAAPWHPYILQLWSTDGNLVRELRPIREWFPAGEQASPTTFQGIAAKPPTQVKSLAESADGHLWVSLTVPNPAYRQPADARTPEELLAGRVSGVIEALDPVTGDLLASISLPRTVSFVAPDRYADQTELDDGHIQIVIYRIRLDAPPPVQ
jgi:hypothetical protein